MEVPSKQSSFDARSIENCNPSVIFMKSSYKHISGVWKRPAGLLRKKTLAWRSQSVVARIERPTRLNRARALGWRPKQGFVLARIRIAKGGRMRPRLRKGRGPSKSGRRFTPEASKQAIAERRAARAFPNLEVLNSYYAGEDGAYRYYEVIFVDPHHPAILADRRISWIANQRRRAFRGLTSAAKKSRGIATHRP